MLLASVAAADVAAESTSLRLRCSLCAPGWPSDTDAAALEEDVPCSCATSDLVLTSNLRAGCRIDTAAAASPVMGAVEGAAAAATGGGGVSSNVRRTIGLRCCCGCAGASGDGDEISMP